MMTIEQIVALHKKNAATAFDLGEKALAGVEKLTELNLQTAKTLMAETAEHTQAVLGVKDMQDLVALQNAMLQPVGEKVAAYNRHVYDIASSLSAEFAKVAEAQAAEAQKQFVSALDSAVKNAPQGSEPAVAAVKNAVSTAAAAMESVQKAVKQATELAEANLKAVATTAVNATKSPRAAKA
ncbi:Phasin (PHA-granule associated protein) [Tepidimonas fonticaldi]|uniref:Phasin (PHA-granule associated protein) n=1 Tax=Tepidimonas fonticaldi TaxID=1101373 RepID=A0A1A6DXG9_9BURK|nr:phasin family protein [Tepidimonas fonticaldi]MCX7663130.1 phasin family protein [Tepidimonas fonticaldi]OBS31485.1 Phasin (PHA-granule associated protein) [Tepidimonas fonticaldi]